MRQCELTCIGTTLQRCPNAPCELPQCTLCGKPYSYREQLLSHLPKSYAHASRATHMKTRFEPKPARSQYSEQPQQRQVLSNDAATNTAEQSTHSNTACMATRLLLQQQLQCSLHATSVHPTAAEMDCTNIDILLCQLYISSCLKSNPCQEQQVPFHTAIFRLCS